QKATEELEKFGDAARDLLRRFLNGKPSLEQRQRVEQLLARLGKPATSAYHLRVVRAIEVLERVGNPEAREVLRSLAGGLAGAPTTEEAKKALQRLERRVPTP